MSSKVTKVTKAKTSTPKDKVVKASSAKKVSKVTKVSSEVSEVKSPKPASISKTNAKTKPSGKKKLADKGKKVVENVSRSKASKKRDARKAKSSAGKDAKKVVRKIDSSPSDVAYLGHIPHNFAETDMSSFFKQFGDIKKIKLFRSQKTGASKGYAFIKFNDEATAVTVSEAMNGYFLGDRQLVSHVVPKNKIHKGMFLIARKNGKGNNDQQGSDSDDDNMEVAAESKPYKAAKNIQQLKKKQNKLKKLGINFDFLDKLTN